MNAMKYPLTQSAIALIAASTVGTASAAETPLQFGDASAEQFLHAQLGAVTYQRIVQGSGTPQISFREVIRCGVENRVSKSVADLPKNGDGFDEDAAIRNAKANATSAGESFQDGFLNGRVCNDTCPTRYEFRSKVDVYGEEINSVTSWFSRQYSATAYYAASVGLICTGFDDM